MSEIRHDPREVYAKVLHHNERDKDGSHADTSQARVDIVECNDGTASVRLSDGDFKDEGGDGDEDDGEEVRDEPL